MLNLEPNTRKEKLNHQLNLDVTLFILVDCCGVESQVALKMTGWGLKPL